MQYNHQRMTRYLLFISIILSFAAPKLWAQTQVVANGGNTSPVAFPGPGCVYKWVNDQPGIGLPASGTGDIASFTAVNTGSTPVTATITARPAPSGFAYITNYGSDNVSVIDIGTNTVVATINVGSGPWAVALTPDSKFAYITNLKSNNVSVINTASNAVIATIPVGLNPGSAAISPDGTRLYVANLNSQNISVISTATNQVISQISAQAPGGVVVSPDGKLIYVTSSAPPEKVSVINASSGAVLATIGVGAGAENLALTPDGKKLFVANTSANTVTIINTITNSVVTTVAASLLPSCIAVSPDGSKAYVTNSNGTSITVINTATNVAANQPSSPGFIGLSFSSDGSQLYAADASGVVVDLDAATLTPVANISVGSFPHAIGSFITKATCTGSPVTFTITVNPTATVPTITAGVATGYISACSGTVSVAPDIEQFTVSGSSLTGNITAAASAGFEISLSPSSGYTNSLVFTPSGGAVGNTVIYVRSAASASAGSISGQIRLTSAGATGQNVLVSGTINPLPVVNPIADQTIFNGAPSNVINFSGSGNTYNWINDMPSIGLAASGTGDIFSFIGVNTGTTPVTAHVTATPITAGLAYVPNFNGKSVSVINTASNAVVATIPVGTSPFSVAVSADGSRVYIANQGYTLSVINTSTNQVVSTIGTTRSPTGLAVSPDGSKLYVGYYSNATVNVFNTTTNALINTITVGIQPMGLIMSPDGRRVYVANSFDNTVSVINTANDAVVATIPVGTSPLAIAISPDGNTVYVTNSVSGNVSVINTAINAVTATISTGSLPESISVSPDGSKIYVANKNSNNVSVIDAGSNTVIATLAVGVSPLGVSVTADGRYIYVANSGANNISVINASTNAVVATINAGSGPTAIGNFITNGIGCSGAPITFKITVKPPIPTGITATGTTGNISACAGSPSASPQIQRFTVSGSNLTGNITATAPAGFEISLNNTSGYSNSLSIPQSGGVVNNTVIYVRSSASAATGDINGNIILASPGATSLNVPVTGVVFAVPTVNSVANQAIQSGSNTTAVSFSGTGDLFNWTNDTPSIGLPASGGGDIASFTGINSGSTPVTAKITVTAKKQPRAYVSNGGSNSVSVINTETGNVVTTIPVGTFPEGVSVSRDGTRAYVANAVSNNVSVIDTKTNTVINSIPVGTSPFAVIVSPDGSKVYVTNEGPQTVSVIDVASNSVIKTIPQGQQPQYMAMSADGSRLYVTNTGSFNISVISTQTNAVVGTVNLGFPPYAIVAANDNTNVYVTDPDNNAVAKINAVTSSFVASIPVGLAPYGLTLSPDGSRLYAANVSGNSVSVINTSTNAVIAAVPVGHSPWGMSVTADGSRVLVANKDSQSISIIDANANTVISTVGVGVAPYSFGNFIAGFGDCVSTPITFNITVNPSIPTGINASTAIGGISACAGTASASPQIQQFTVSGSSLTGKITATAPAGFEISLNDATGYGNSLTVAESGGIANSTVVYVRSAATAAAGNLTGKVTLASPGLTTQNVDVKATISPLPTVNGVGDQTVTAGTATSPINFTGSTRTFNWTNDTPTIGLAAKGTGSIASFIAQNSGTAPVTATITATPIFPVYAYVTNYAGSSVSVIDVTTNSVISTVTLGSHPYCASVSRDGSRAYVTNNESSSVSVINTVTNNVVGTIPVGLNPGCVTVSPDGGTIYVVCGSPNAVWVMNTATNAVIAKIPIVSSANEVTISPDGSRIYVTTASANSVSVIDASSNTVIAVIPVQTMPYGIVTSPDGSKVYVTNEKSNNISVIDASTNQVISTIPTGFSPTGLAISPDGTRLYTANSDPNTVSVISIASGTVIATVRTGNFPHGIAISPDGSTVYAVNESSSNVTIINAATNTVIKTINVGLDPLGLGNFIPAYSGCNGAPVTFTITVNPVVTVPPTITAGAVSGYMLSCPGVASAIPDIQQFTVSGSGLTADVTATVPPGFELSLAPGSGFGNSVIVKQAAGNINNVVVYVRLSASAPVGNVAGSVLLTSAGAVDQSVTVNGKVNQAPVVNTVPDQSVVAGSNTTDINFTGNANLYSWVNDSPGIGLAANGVGDIKSFTTVNAGVTPVVAHVTVTPFIDGHAYIPDYYDNNVSVINTATNAVIAKIGVGSGPVGVAVSPDGSRVYISNDNDQSVSEINTSTNKVINTYSVGLHPSGMVVSPDGKFVYVSSGSDNNVVVLNIANPSNIIFPIPVGKAPYGLALNADGSRLYVANYFDNTVSVINTQTNIVINTIAVGTQPVSVAMSADGSHVYVLNQGSNTMSVINAQTGIVETTVPVGQEPTGLAVSPDGSKLYITNTQLNHVSVIDAKTYSVITTINTGTLPYGISMTGDGAYVYVANKSTNNVSVISTLTNQLVATVPVGTTPYAFGNFINNGTNCAGTPITFNITVTPNIYPTIKTGALTGVMVACVGSPSATPNIAQFTVSGINLTTAITAKASPGFEVSLTATGGYAANVALPQSGGKVLSTVIYVRSSAAAATGNASGNVTLLSAGAPDQTVAVTAIINPLIAVNPVGNQTYTNGQQTAAINFAGTAGAYKWVNDTPGIGLAANGTGDISSFIAVNTGATPITATVTVTPQRSGYAYVTNWPTNSISVVNTTTNRVDKIIPVGLQPFGVALSADGNFVYVSNTGSDYISVISTTANAVVSTIQVKPNAHFIKVSPDGNFLYVTYGEDAQMFTVVDLRNNTSFDVTAANWGYELAFSPDGSLVYIADTTFNNLRVYNTSTNALVGSIPVGVGAYGVAISPDGSKAYVTNLTDNTVSVVNTSTYATIATISVGNTPTDIILSADGSKLYVGNNGSANVSVINTATNAVTATVRVGASVTGLSLSPDGKQLYVGCYELNAIKVINTQSNTVTATIPAGQSPQSFGNYVTGPVGCPGNPITFTITVNPIPVIPPSITAGLVSGSISACAGTPSASPDIQQFTVSGSNLTANIIATAPNGFGVSLSAAGGYGNSVTINQSGGSVSSRMIYVRSAAGATGNISGDIILSSAGATSQNVTVTGTINALPIVNQLTDQLFDSGVLTTAINFTGTGPVFNWVNDTPGIGLAASGTGNIAPFTPINAGRSPVTATITVTPASPATGCPGTPMVFSIIVKGAAAGTPGITVGPIAGNIFACAGTASVSPNIQQFTVSANGLTGDITATAPPDFEVSLSPATGYGNSVTLSQAAGVVNNLTVYVRSAATAAAGDISGNIVLSSAGFAEPQVAVSGTIDDIPVVNSVSNQTYTNNDQTSPIAFTGASSSFSWVNDTPGIGLPASGTGDIASFKAVNLTNAPITATITVTPQPVDSYAYVASQSSNTVGVINTATGATVATIGVGTAPFGVAVSPDNRRVYVTNMGSNDVSVINTLKNVVIATVPVSLKPAGVAISPDGNKVYVANSGSATVSVINGASDIVEAKIPVGSTPHGLVVSHSGAVVSLVNGVDATFIDAVSNGISSTTAAGMDGFGIAVSPNDQHVYATDAGANKLWAISQTGSAVEAMVPTGSSPSGVCVSPDGNTVYTANTNSNTVTVINSTRPTNLSVAGNINVGQAPNSICFGKDGKLLYVVNGGSNTLSAIDPVTNKVVATFPTGASPSAFGNFITGPIGCGGQPITFTITVNPSPVIPPPPSIIIPNTFTPNGDGVNDTWDIKNMAPCQDCTVNVFDRYGGKVFSSLGYGKPWDGTYNGSKLPVGTYYYVINIQRNLKVLSGFVAIIR